MIKWIFILLLSNLFSDTIVYNHYPPKLFWKAKPKPTIKVLEDVKYRGITRNYLISQKDWGVLGNRLYEIPCNDVIEAKYTNGSLIQYNCNEDTSIINIVNEDSEIQYSNFKSNYLIIPRIEDNWINPILTDGGIYFYDKKKRIISKELCKTKEMNDLKKFYQIDCTENKNIMAEDEFLKLIERRIRNFNVGGLDVLLYGSLYILSKPLRSDRRSSFNNFNRFTNSVMAGGVILSYSILRLIIRPLIRSINIDRYKTMSKENKIRMMNVWYENSGDELILAYLLNMEGQ